MRAEQGGGRDSAERPGQTAEDEQSVVFLYSKAAGYVTGSMVTVDGGKVMR